jgi:RNA polymerase sigma factor (TIGR02999 family)
MAEEQHCDAEVDPHAATRLLVRVSTGDSAAAEMLLPLVYEQLRAMAGSYFRGQPADQTLQPTALVHEAYLRLVRQPDSQWESRAHFCAVAATAMRQVLKDRARRRRAAKRGGGDAQRVPLEQLETPSGGKSIDLIALDDALTRLAKLDARQGRIVELRFFGGLTVEEVAHVLGLSTRMIEKEWRRVRAWLSRELSIGESE